MMDSSDKPPRRILVVDDEPDIGELLSDALSHCGYEVCWVDSGEAALRALYSFAPDLILLDVSLPEINGLELLELLRRQEKYVACIFVSGKGFSDDIVKGLDGGADDYIVKPFDMPELLARVRSQLRIKDLNDSLSKANHQLLQLIDIDDLTGLFNMRSLFQKLDSEIVRAERFGRNVCVIMMDMDHFKQVNDKHDHLFGSFVLSQVGALIKDNIRRVDFAARYGGDEFLIVLTESHLEGAKIFAERLRKTIEQKTFSNDLHSMRLTVSVGLAICAPAENFIDAKELVRAADRALYIAKENGRNQVAISPPLAASKHSA